MSLDHMPDYVHETLKHYGKSENIICPQCKGVGFEWHDVGHHTSDFESELCPVCKGDKIVMKLTWSAEFIVRHSDDTVKDRWHNHKDDKELNKLITREAKRLLEE